MRLIGLLALLLGLALVAALVLDARREPVRARPWDDHPPFGVAAH